MNLKTIVDVDNPATRINRCYEGNNKPRHHLGLSQAGHECPRYKWYKYYGYQELPIKGQVLRLLELGKLTEDTVTADLRLAGYEVTGEQDSVSYVWGDLTLTGHIDGLITGLSESKKTHLLEIKSSNDKRFQQLRKGGYEAWSGIYKFQIHAYMLDLDLDRCLVVVYNKNTSELYTERISLRQQWIKDKLSGIFEILEQKTPPCGICRRADFYKARWCGYREVCF